MTFASERVARHSLRIPHLYAVEFLRHPPVVFQRWQADAGPSLVDCFRSLDWVPYELAVNELELCPIALWLALSDQDTIR